jgi:hypothetical protein
MRYTIAKEYKMKAKVGDLIRATANPMGRRYLGWIARKDAYDILWVQWFDESMADTQVSFYILVQDGRWKVEVADKGRWVENEVSKKASTKWK